MPTITSVELEQDKDVLLGSRQVSHRYDDVCYMTLWRWIKNHELGFPKPIYIGRRRYWSLAELKAWEKSRPRGQRA